VADKRCENGHFIDESWDLCPYCPPVARTGDIPVIRPRRVDDEYRQHKTEDDSARRRALSDSQKERLLRAVDPPAPDSLDGVQRTVAAPKMDPAAAVVLPRFVVGWLLVLTGPSRGDAYPVRMGKNIIGRDRRCDVVVNDEQASAHHADLVFRPEEGRFILMDHNSTNGTFVNGTEIEPRKDLANKDVVRVGLQKFLFLSLSSTGFSWDDPESAT